MIFDDGLYFKINEKVVIHPIYFVDHGYSIPMTPVYGRIISFEVDLTKNPSTKYIVEVLDPSGNPFIGVDGKTIIEILNKYYLLKCRDDEKGEKNMPPKMENKKYLTFSDLIQPTIYKYGLGNSKNDFDEAVAEGVDDELDRIFGDIRIIYNNPATVVFWGDGTKTVVKLAKGEKFNKYTAFCAALGKKMYGTNSSLNKIVNSGYDQEAKKKKTDKKKGSKKK